MHQLVEVSLMLLADNLPHCYKTHYLLNGRKSVCITAGLQNCNFVAAAGQKVFFFVWFFFVFLLLWAASRHWLSFLPLVIIHKSCSVSVPHWGRAAITQTLVSMAVAVWGVITTITVPLCQRRTSFCCATVIVKVNREDSWLFLPRHEYCSSLMAAPHFSLLSSFIQHHSQCLFPLLLHVPLLHLIKLNEECVVTWCISRSHRSHSSRPRCAACTLSL